MIVKEEHKALLKEVGLVDEDFELFDGEFVRYEFDEKRGVRIYDPYYTTSYNEYIGIDGWSAWSDEGDTFMSDILKKTHETIRLKEAAGPKASEKDISTALQKKFVKKSDTDTE
ncbi:MAG: hypothetical protein JRL30_22380 [Deltaproteobacteria bacterium]|nr:hypothetical protein [Deltaproteobacteria bacterium]